MLLAPLLLALAPLPQAEPLSTAARARELLAALGPRAAEVRKPFEDPERRRWRRDPSPRPGVALGDMTEEQRGRVRALLATVLSARGLAVVEGILAEQNVLGEGEEGLGDGFYWFALYGEPGAERWAWRLGGHHVSVHATYAGEALVGLTPLLLGGEREGEPVERWTGYRLVRPREELARALVGACDEDEWRRVCLQERALGALELSEPTLQPLATADEGLALAGLRPALATQLHALIEEHVAALGTPLGVPTKADLERDAARVTFAWFGSREPGKAHAYRIRAPGLLIEYVSSGAHIHSLLRTGADWGDGR
ncbi:MAG TPA: DUF3500 domain-containing protein [Planctomycetota bacterium]